MGMTPLRRILLAAVLVVATAVATWASDLVTYERVSVGTTAVGLSATTLEPPGLGQINFCWGRVENFPIRLRYDGTNPTATNGIYLAPDDLFTVASHEDARRLRMIATESGFTATVVITCELRPRPPVW